jgi:hypothetical protein
LEAGWKGDILQSLVSFHIIAPFQTDLGFLAGCQKSQNPVRYKRRTETLHLAKAQKDLYADLEIPPSAKIAGISFLY